MNCQLLAHNKSADPLKFKKSALSFGLTLILIWPNAKNIEQLNKEVNKVKVKL